MQLWSQARQMAAQTPEERNRYVDFLRSVSILAVIVGHWMIATAYVVDGEISAGHLLVGRPQLHWLTWIFQVMPIFFIVGGYANAVSLESARRRGVGYAGWLSARLNRLVGPLLVLIIAWAAIAVVLGLFSARPTVIQYVSQAALIPTWFLAIYIVVVILAPAVYRFWQRFGFASFVVFAAAAALTDVAFFAADMQWLGWTNYLWVWLAVHHLGFAWRDDRLGRVTKRLLFAASGFAALWLLTSYGPYPLAMVGSPDPGLSNTLPPKITLLCAWHFSIRDCCSLWKNPMRRVLQGLRLWTATVLINSMIMTVYLWHITVMVIFRGAIVSRRRYWTRGRTGNVGLVVVTTRMDRDFVCPVASGRTHVVATRATGSTGGCENSCSGAPDRRCDDDLPGGGPARPVRLRRRAR